MSLKILAAFIVPAPYFSPIFQIFEKRGIDFTVLYGLRIGDGEKYFDHRSGKYVFYGANVLEGYQYLFLDDEIRETSGGGLKINNPRIMEIVRKGGYDVILNSMSYWSPATWMMIRIAKGMRIPMVTRATVEAKRKRNSAVRLIKKLVVGKYCREMDAGVYECKSQRDYLVQYGMEPESLFFRLAPWTMIIFGKRRRNLIAMQSAKRWA